MKANNSMNIKRNYKSFMLDHLVGIFCFFISSSYSVHISFTFLFNTLSLNLQKD
jgi:hypothetical protein